MNTLLNGSLPGEEVLSPSEEVALNTIPEAKSSAKGVSVRYVKSGGKGWYVFRASYNREVMAANDLIESGIYAYVVQRYVMTEKDGKRRKTLKSLIPNIVFAYIDAQSANKFVKDFNAQRGSFLSFYYNHFAKDTYGNNPPLVVPDDEMENFIKATATNSEHLKSVIPEKCRFLGKEVEIVRGYYKGVRGLVARVAGQQCVVVSLANGEFQISTEYIPTAYMREIR